MCENEMTDAIWDIVRKRLVRLTFGCLGCPKTEECEHDGENKDSRFCETLIKAAVLGKDEFEIPWEI